MTVLETIDRFPLGDIASFMRHPEIYGAGGDDLTPPAQNVDFEGFITQHNVLTYILPYDRFPVGFVQFVLRNSIMAEMHVGFLPLFRGRVARKAITEALRRVFAEKGVLKVMAQLPSDARAALRLAAVVGFEREGRLRRAILRNGNLIDLIILGVSRNV